MNIYRYEASGGPSAQIAFENGEKLRVEAHEGSFGLTWPSNLSSGDIPVVVKELLSDPVGDCESWVIIGERGIKHHKVPASDALDMLEKEDDVRFARIDTGDTILTWRAALDEGGNPEIGYGSEIFNAERIARLLGRTVVESLKEHDSEIVAQITPFIDKYKRHSNSQLY